MSWKCSKCGEEVTLPAGVGTNSQVWCTDCWTKIEPLIRYKQNKQNGK